MDQAVMSVRMKKWAGIIQEAVNSGLTKTEFCEKNGINRRQFFLWQKRIREYVLEHNPELGLPLPQRGQIQQIREVNAQILPSLPVFCELKPQKEENFVPASQIPMNAFCPEAMIQCGKYQIFVVESATERTLTIILSVIHRA